MAHEDFAGKWIEELQKNIATQQPHLRLLRCYAQLVLFRFADAGPEQDDDLRGDADDEDQPNVLPERQSRQKGGGKRHPQKKCDNAVISPRVKPDRIENQPHDDGDRRSAKESEIVIRCDDGNPMECDEGDRCEEPHQHDAHCGDQCVVSRFYRLLVGRLRRVGRRFAAHQLVQRNAEEIGDLRQHRHVRQRLGALPFADGLIGIVEFFGKFGLRHTMLLAQFGQVFGNVLPHVRHCGALPSCV